MEKLKQALHAELIASENQWRAAQTLTQQIQREVPYMPTTDHQIITMWLERIRSTSERDVWRFTEWLRLLEGEGEQDA